MLLLTIFLTSAKRIFSVAANNAFMIKNERTCFRDCTMVTLTMMHLLSSPWSRQDSFSACFLLQLIFRFAFAF